MCCERQRRMAAQARKDLREAEERVRRRLPVIIRTFARGDGIRSEVHRDAVLLGLMQDRDAKARTYDELSRTYVKARIRHRRQEQAARARSARAGLKGGRAAD